MSNRQFSFPVSQYQYRDMAVRMMLNDKKIVTAELAGYLPAGVTISSAQVTTDNTASASISNPTNDTDSAGFTAQAMNYGITVVTLKLTLSNSEIVNQRFAVQVS